MFCGCQIDKNYYLKPSQYQNIIIIISINNSLFMCYEGILFLILTLPLYFF